MTVSNCQNWHMYHAKKTNRGTLGEPDALKGASPVRRGIVGKGPSSGVHAQQLKIVPRWRFTLPKLLKNKEHRRKKITKKRYKGLDKPPKYSSPTVEYIYGHDYTFKCDQQVSVNTLNGRIILPYQGYDRHVMLIRDGATLGDAKLWYDAPKKTFYLLVSLKLHMDIPAPTQLQKVIGVDVGVRYLAVTSTETGKATFYPGKQIRHKANHFARLRKRLQRKGTRGATRKLKRIAQRERRFKLQENHVIAKQISTQHPQTLIGLEELSGIRERTKRRKRKRKKNGKGYERVSLKARKANRVYSQWSFAELHALISYKAVLSGSLVVKVDAYMTSQACPICGHTGKENRPNKGLLFICQNPKCQYTLHADLIGARNVVMRTLLARQDWTRTGFVSMAPDASDDEAKAARRKRYAELRWSPGVTNKLPLSEWG